VYLEAMRHGRAVLAGDCDAGREVVVDGVTGRTVDARSESELLDGLAEVLGFSGERMGCAGQERYRQLFSYPAFVERLAAHYTGLLAGRIHTPEVRLQVN
jgi:glycosyltransferase involved in cell wall biosynthesis